MGNDQSSAKDPTLRMIKMVQCDRALWDPADEDYANQDYVQKTWHSMAQVLGFSMGPAVQLKWKSLRDEYVDHRRRGKRPASLKYFKALSFLDEII